MEHPCIKELAVIMLNGIIIRKVMKTSVARKPSSKAQPTKFADHMQQSNPNHSLQFMTSLDLIDRNRLRKRLGTKLRRPICLRYDKHWWRRIFLTRRVTLLRWRIGSHGRHTGATWRRRARRRIIRILGILRLGRRHWPRETQGLGSRIATTEEFLQPQAHLCTSRHRLPSSRKPSLLIRRLGVVPLQREKEEARQDWAQEREGARHSASNFLAEHRPSEHEPTFD